MSVSVNVPEGVEAEEITVEFTLDGDVVVILAWPHDGERVDRATLMQTLAMAQQAIPQILDQMEAPQ